MLLFLFFYFIYFLFFTLSHLVTSLPTVGIVAHRRVPRRERAQEPARDRRELQQRDRGAVGVVQRRAADVVLRTAVGRPGGQGRRPGGTVDARGRRAERGRASGATADRAAFRVGAAGQDCRTGRGRVPGRHRGQPPAVRDRVDQERRGTGAGRPQDPRVRRTEQVAAGHRAADRRGQWPVHVPRVQRGRGHELHDRRDR